jgi:hypothetical protein
MQSRNVKMALMGAALLALAGTAAAGEFYFPRQSEPGLRISSNAPGFKARLGYQLSPSFALEGGYLETGSTSPNAAFSNTTLSGGLNVSALGYMPLNDQLSLFGKLGFTTGAPVSLSQDKNTLGMGLGGIYQLTPRLGLRAEWERPSGDINLLTFGLQARF